MAKFATEPPSFFGVVKERKSNDLTKVVPISLMITQKDIKAVQDWFREGNEIFVVNFLYSSRTGRPYGIHNKEYKSAKGNGSYGQANRQAGYQREDNNGHRYSREEARFEEPTSEREIKEEIPEDDIPF